MWLEPLVSVRAGRKSRTTSNRVSELTLLLLYCYSPENLSSKSVILDRFTFKTINKQIVLKNIFREKFRHPASESGTMRSIKHSRSRPTAWTAALESSFNYSQRFLSLAVLNGFGPRLLHLQAIREHSQITWRLGGGRSGQTSRNLWMLPKKIIWERKHFPPSSNKVYGTFASSLFKTPETSPRSSQIPDPKGTVP